MACSRSEFSSRSRLNCGLKRERGNERTSPSAVTPWRVSSAMKCSIVWLLWPTVRSSAGMCHAPTAWHMPAELLTVGHSNHTIEHFIALLTRHGVTALGDVRSFPRSRFNPQFNRDRLEAALRAHGIGYVFLGDALGG